MEQPKFLIYCNNCKENKNHFVRSEFRFDRMSEDVFDDYIQSQIIEIEDNQIIQCMKCGEVSFRTVTRMPFYDGTEGITGINIYPERTDGFLFDFAYGCPDEIRKVFSEVIFAFNHNMNISVQLGLTAIINGIIYDKDLNCNDYFKSIDLMLDRKMITKNDHEFLKENNYIFSAGFKELYQFKKEILSTCINRVSSILISIYNAPKINKKIKGAIEDSFNE